MSLTMSVAAWYPSKGIDMPKRAYFLSLLSMHTGVSIEAITTIEKEMTERVGRKPKRIELEEAVWKFAGSIKCDVTTR